MRPTRVWITGASQGIGRACAERFAKDGAALALCARRAAPLEHAAEALRDLGATCASATVADVAVLEQVNGFAREALDALGGCDILVHNAGGGGPGGVLGGDDDAFEADWRYAFDVNVMAAARLARAASEALQASKGVIVLLSSAWRHRPGSEMPASYGAAKAALDDLTQSLAREFGPRGVRVVGIAPGPIWTETWERDLQRHAERDGLDPEQLRESVIAEAGGATAMGRPGTMEEIARAIHWAASPEASYLTGTTLLIDGGFVAGS